MSEHDGHRSRIIEKLDSDTLLEHEILEVLLFNAQPRKNTNDIAHRLLAKFGSIYDIFTATFEELQTGRGVGPSIASYLVCIGKFYKVYFDFSKTDFEGVFTPYKFLPFVNKVYHREKKEVMDVYLLDEDSMVFDKCRFSVDSFCEVSVEPNDVVQLLLDKKPSGLVMVHNHPFGIPTPSSRDEYMTSKMQLVCSFHNVLFCDHVIYSPSGTYSYYMSGRMQKISSAYSVAGLLPNMEEGE